MREYIVNPYQMAAVSGRYYLIGNYDKYEDVGHYRKAKQVDLVLEDEDGNTLLDTEKKEVLGAVCCQIQNSLDHPKRITTCLAVVEPGRDGLWLASPNSLLEHVGSSYIHQIELALPPEMPEFTATPFPSVPSTMEEEYYEQEQNF